MRLVTLGLAAALLTGIGSAFILSSRQAPAPGSRPAFAAVTAPGGCVAAPGACGFPDATTAGVPPGMPLRAVPGELTSGPGWHIAPDGAVEVTGNGAVLSGLSIHGSLDIVASNVTIKDDQIVTGGSFAISLRHTAGVTIENSTISGQNAADGRVTYAIDDTFGDSNGMVIANNNISYFRTAVQLTTGLVIGNYIHDPGYQAGDHTNGIYVGATDQPLTIYHNTIFNHLGQTDAIYIYAPKAGELVANKTIEDNLLAGGGYTIYGGVGQQGATSHIVIENNQFGRAYYPKGGYYGPIAYFSLGGTGNAWSGNTWTGGGSPGATPIPFPIR